MGHVFYVISDVVAVSSLLLCGGGGCEGRILGMVDSLICRLCLLLRISVIKM